MRSIEFPKNGQSSKQMSQAKAQSLPKTCQKIKNCPLSDFGLECHAGGGHQNKKMKKFDPKMIIIWLLYQATMTSSAKVPEEVKDLDNPLYSLKPPDYMAAQMDLKAAVIYSDYNVCYYKPHIRLTYGNEIVEPKAHAIPLQWSDYLSVLSMISSEPLYDLVKKGDLTEIFVPFIFMVLILGIALFAIIPYIIVGTIMWLILFNLRLLGHKKVRMVIRSILIHIEKYRRWKYERSFHPQQLRKFRERDRYQMPKAFQNSDLSSDDEPAELTREQIKRTQITMWDLEEKNLIGFDPDNIPMEIVYGDLLNSREKVDPEVRKYVAAISKRTKLQNKDRTESVTSEEWILALKDEMEKQQQLQKEEEEKSKQTFLGSLKKKFFTNEEENKREPMAKLSTPNVNLEENQLGTGQQKRPKKPNGPRPPTKNNLPPRQSTKPKGPLSRPEPVTRIGGRLPPEGVRSGVNVGRRPGETSPRPLIKAHAKPADKSPGGHPKKKKKSPPPKWTLT